MKQLTTGKFAKARAYMLGNARPLEQALFSYYFENGPAAAIWQELGSFQNSDGGFGHALESDLRTPSSSALATGIALKLLAETGAPIEHPLAQEACAYLENTLDLKTLTWRAVSLDTNDHPHAPWWHDKDGSLANTFDHFQVIPRSELVAFLYHFSDQEQAPWLEDMTKSTVAALENMPLGTGGGDDLVYAIRLATAERLPDNYRQRVMRRVREVTPEVVTRDPKEWEKYSIPPLKLAPSPNSPVADLLTDVLEKNLDFVIEQQTADGFWEPTWTWGEFYPDIWPIARDEWRGVITYHNLCSLKACGRLA